MGSFRYPLEEIRSRCDLVDLISNYVSLKRSGRNFTGLCPFHADKKTPSFTVNPEIQRYRCFGCGENGDVFSFIMRMEGLTFPEAVEQLAKKVGVVLERSPEMAKQFSEREQVFHINTLALAFFRKNLAKSETAQEYLARRGIKPEILERYRIGFAPDDWNGLGNYFTSQKISLQDVFKAGLVVPRENGEGYYDRFRNRIIFPILDVQDRVVGFGGRAMGDDQPKYLNSPETPVFIKNKILYGLNIARRTTGRAGYVIVVEGYMDAVTVQSAGFENAVATMGTALTQEHVNILSRYTTNAVLAFDSDSAGMAAALRSAPMFEEAGFNVRIIAMPSGHDPDSLLRNGDSGVFARLVEEALPIADFRIRKVKEGFDLSTREGKVAALKQILPVLAEVRDTVERERLITELAPLHPNYGTGTTLAEDHLRREVERLSARKKEPPVRRTGSEQAQDQEPIPRPRAGSIDKAERALLGIILSIGPESVKALNSLRPEDYISDAAKTLASAVYTQYAALGKIELNQLATELQGTEGEDLLNEILVGSDSPEMTFETVDELVKVIINYKKKEKLNKFRLLADKVQSGQVESEEIAEYLRLVKELKGSSSS